MADLEKFQNGLAQALFSPYGDHKFETVRTVCCGMSGVKTAKLINFAVSCLDKDEIYLEIGVYTGFTMISAGLGLWSPIFGIDNFSQFGDNAERMAQNFTMFSHPSYKFLNMDFRNVVFDVDNQKKVGVFYVDGKHDYKEVMDSFEWAERNVLSDKAIVILDDISVNGVSDAINDWLSAHPNYKTIFYFKPYFDGKSEEWQRDMSAGLGFAVLKREAVNV